VRQIVQTRAAPRSRRDACTADQPVKGLFDCNVTQRQTLCVNEHRVSFRTGPATRQIALQAGHRRVVQRRQASFAELGLADQQAVASRRRPSTAVIVKALRPIIDGTDAVFPIIGGDGVAARIADDRESELLDEIEHVATKAALVGGRVAGLVDAAIDAATQMLDEGAEQAPVYPPS